MLVGAPGLHRAVAECTQPHGPPAGAEVSKALQKYLSDVKCTDTVYKALLNRASIEPKSEVVIQKVVGVLKQFLPRYAPSKEVIGLIDEFCVNLSLCLSPSAAGLKKSLAYVKATITLPQNPSGALKQSASAPGLTRSDASPSRQAAPGSGDPAEGDGTPSDIQRARSLFTMMSVENGQAAPAAHDVSSLEMLPGAIAQRLSLRKERELQESQPSSPPEWAIPPSVFPMPHTRTHPHHLRAWAQLLPQYHHSLQLLLTRPEGGLGEMDVANSHDTLWELTGQDPDELMQHLEELTALSNKGSPAAPGQKQKPNMFSCTQPYSQAERLNAEPAIVEAVLEAVLGVVPPPSTCTEDTPQGRPSAGVWATAKVFLWEARGTLPSVGQMCFSILLKLVMDMYVQNGPLMSFPLTHRLLSQGLRHSSSSIRARVFSVLYNLAIHAIGFEALPTEPPPNNLESPSNTSPIITTPQPRVPGVMTDGGPGGSWRVPSHPGPHPGSAHSHHFTPPPSPLLQPSPSPSPALRSTPAPANPVGQATERVSGMGRGAEQLKRWLLMLLYQMLSELAEMEEGTEEVWQAALGCMLYMTTQSGCFVRSAVEPFPLDVLSQLLRACLHFGWSMELYCQLLHLSCYLLTRPPLEGEDPSAPPHTLGWCCLDATRLEAFGGTEELLFHFCEAPTLHMRRETLYLLLLAVKPQDMSQQEVDAMREVLCANRPLPDILQVALRSPLPGLAEAILSTMQDLIKHVPSSAKKLLNRLEKLALSFLDSPLFSDAEQGVADVLAQGGPDGLYRAWRVLQEVVECGDSSGSKLAAYCVTRLIQVNSQDLQDTLLPSPNASLPDAGSVKSQHPQQQIIQVIRALLEECTDGVSIFLDMVCQLILTFKEEALSMDLTETPSTPQPAQPSESEKLLIAHAIVNTWTAALEWLVKCSNVPPSVLYRVTDMVLSTLTCLPGNPVPPALQDAASSMSGLLAATVGLNNARERDSDIGWDTLDRMLLPQLVLHGHVPFYVPCLQLVPLHCLVLLLQSFPASQSSVQRLMLGRPGSISNVTNPLNVPWHDSFSSSRVALLLALVCANAHSPVVAHLKEVLEPLMDCNDMQVRHLISVQILKHWFTHSSAEYWQYLQKLLLKAQQQDDEKMLLNPYLQVRSILKLQVR